MKFKELFSDALPLIQKFAPTIGAAIGGPMGLATGYVIPILANAFGSKPNDFKDLVKNILNDSHAQEKLESIEHEHGDWVCTLMDSVNNLSSMKINIELTWQSDKK